MEPYRSQAEMFKSLDSMRSQQKASVTTDADEEPKVQEAVKKNKKNSNIDILKIVADAVASEPWKKALMA